MGAIQAEDGHSLPLEILVPWKELDPMALTNPHCASGRCQQVLPPLLPPQLSFKAPKPPADVKPFAEARGSLVRGAFESSAILGQLSGLQSGCFLQTGRFQVAESYECCWRTSR